jgi:magnesium and cobalt exporter, CNNM family
VNTFANALLAALRVETKNEITATFSDDELARLVKDSTAAGLIDDRAQERLHDALELGRRPVRDVVVPLERVVYARMGITPEELEQLAGESGFSRFPVVDENRRIIGYLHVKDALDTSPSDRSFRLRDIRPIPRVREDTPLDDVLTAMRRSRTHLAAVMGEDGRLAGLVTMEDVLRQLFGLPA